MRFRSARLEALLGSQIDKADYRAVADLVGNPNAAESDDLDYKIKYDPGSTDREEIAKDIAAFANSVGGLLVVGMADDKDTALPTRALETNIEDKLLRWIRETAATNIAPLPEFDVIPIASPTNPRSGFILIAVPRSPAAPHAVFNPSARRALAYPRRHGRTTTWLPESSVATAYRERFAGAQDREDRLKTIESDLLDAFWEESQWEPVLVLSMVPELPGELLVSAESLRDFQQAAQQEVFFGNDRVKFELCSVGAGKMQVRSAPRPVDLHAELYSDGSAAWGSVPWHTVATEDAAAVHIDDITLMMLNAVRFLARNSQGRAGTTGTVLLRASLFASYVEHRDFISQRPMPIMGRDIEGPKYEYLALGDFVSSRSVRQLGSRRLGSATGEVVAFIDSLADGGAALASTTSALTSKLFQAFGLVECPELSREGHIRKYEWHGQHFAWLDSWVAATDAKFL